MRSPRNHPVPVRLLCVAAVCAALGAGVAGTAPRAHADRASPSPSASGSVSPSPKPSGSPGASATASPKLIAWASKWARLAGRNRRHLDRLRGCLGLHCAAAVPRRPVERLPRDWTAYGSRCKRLDYRWYAEGKRDWRAIRYPKLVSARSWRPLLRFVGWPSYALSDAVTCIRRESGGRPWASNGFCDGLFQINRCHHLNDPFNPLVNCRYALQLWRADGWRDWTTMGGY